jgi:hypothetical protein
MHLAMGIQKTQSRSRVSVAGHALWQRTLEDQIKMKTETEEGGSDATTNKRSRAILSLTETDLVLQWSMRFGYGRCSRQEWRSGSFFRIRGARIDRGGKREEE